MSGTEEREQRMPVVNFAANQLMYAQQGSDMTLFTAPHPMGGLDYAEIIWNISSLDNSSGTPTVTVTAQVSNDGVNWINSTTLTDSKSSVPTDPVQISGYARAAFIRFKYELSVAGSPGDLVWTAFCLHVNLLQSGT